MPLFASHYINVALFNLQFVKLNNLGKNIIIVFYPERVHNLR